MPNPALYYAARCPGLPVQNRAGIVELKVIQRPAGSERLHGDRLSPRYDGRFAAG